MKQTNERLCALAQKGDATALDSLIENNKSFIGKVANDLFRSKIGRASCRERV